LTTTEARTAASFDDDDESVEIIEPDPERYVRASGDVIQVGAAVALFLVTLLGAAVLKAVVSGAEQDVHTLTSLVPEPISQLLTAVVSVVGYLGPLVIAVELVAIRRLRVALMVVAGALLAAAGMWVVSHLLAVQVQLPGNLGELQQVSSTDARWIATASAVVTVINPWLPRVLRRIGIGTIVVVTVTRMATRAYVPYEAAVAIMLGWLSGSAVLAAVGSVNRRPRGAAVARALRAAGVPVARLAMIGGGLRGSTLYQADTREGKRRFVKVFDPNQRETDMLVQFYRWLRLRDAGSPRPFSSLRRAVEHEALLTLAAAKDDVPTPDLVTVGAVDPDGMLLALEFVDGDDLAGLGPGRLDDDLLRSVWQIHARLRAQRIAHRELRLDHFLLQPDGQPVLIDFSSGQIAASVDVLRADTAELLSSTAIAVGPERAVAVAADALGIEALADMIGRLQPLALSRPTRRLLSENDGLLAALQAEVQRVTRLEEVEYEELARLQPRTLLTVVVLALAAYVLLTQFARDSRDTDIPALLASAQWFWVLPLGAFMACTWVGAAVSMSGSVPDRVPFLPMLKTQVAASFVDLLAPAALGGMALTSRFLQKRGVEPARAVAGVGLNAIAGFVAHVVILGLFLLWAGGEDVSSSPAISPPSARTTVLVLGGLALLIGGAWLVPAIRRQLRTRFVPFVRDAAKGLAELARRPRKLLALFGGSALITVCFYGALYCAVRAFGGQVSPAGLGVGYLLASTAAIVAPTPQGVGALEVALGYALRRLGLSPNVAFNSVLLFRLGTLWLPVLPGWLSFRSMTRRGEI
jgi:undecaprenyl-diphosphatase